MAPGGGEGAPPPGGPRRKESAIELGRLVDRGVRVKLAGGREVEGTLKGFDPLLNLVLDEAREYLRGARCSWGPSRGAGAPPPRGGTGGWGLQSRTQGPRACPRCLPGTPPPRPPPSPSPAKARAGGCADSGRMEQTQRTS